MKKLYLVLFGLMLSIVGKSQDLFPFGGPFLQEGIKESNIALQLTSDYQVGASTLNMKLMEKFILGGTISEQIIDENYEDLDPLNHIGQEFTSAINIFWNTDTIFGSENIGLVFSFSDQRLLTGSFTKDAFTLAFYGNADPEKQQYHLDQSAYNQLNFQKFSFGIFNKNTLSFIKINLYGGRKQELVNINSGYFETTFENFADYYYPDSIALYANFEYGIANSDNVYNGFGAGVDLAYNLILEEDKSKIIGLSISDLGFIAWGEDNNSIDSSGVFSFGGYETNTFAGGELSGFIDNMKDSIIPVEEAGSLLTVIPPVFRAYFSHSVNDKLFYRFMVAKRIQKNYKPFVAADVDYKILENLSLGAMLSYGAYTNFSYGLRLEYQFKSKTYLGISVPMLNTLVNKNGHSLGFGVNFIRLL